MIVLRKAVMLLFILAAVFLAGCDQPVELMLGDQVEFLPESGADQYVMYRSIEKSLRSLDFNRYAEKRVYLDADGGTGFTQNLARNLGLQLLEQANAVILTPLTEKDKENGLREEPADFKLGIIVMNCGIHSYDGLFRRNIVGLSLIHLREQAMDGPVRMLPGKLQRYVYDTWILSSYFTIALLALGVILVSLLFAWLLRSNRMAPGDKEPVLTSEPTHRI